MRKLILGTFIFLSITFAGIIPGDAAVSSSNQSTKEITNPDIYTYVYIRIDDTLYLYIYLGDLLIEVQEVEE